MLETHRFQLIRSYLEPFEPRLTLLSTDRLEAENLAKDVGVQEMVRMVNYHPVRRVV